MSRKKIIVLALVIITLDVYLYIQHVLVKSVKPEICMDTRLYLPEREEFFPTEFKHDIVPAATTSTLVLIYTYYFSEKHWPFFKDSHNYNPVCGCNFTRFELIYDRKRFLESDVVIFHGRNMPCVKTLRKLHRQRRPHQLWAYFVLENPTYTDFIEPLDNFFNMSITYRLNSDVYFPYRKHFPMKAQIAKENINYALGKTRQVAWLVSSCGRLREKLAHKFEEYGIKIEVGGKCSKKFKHQLDCKLRSCDAELQKFKFYFAAENSFCEDYITEKYWHKAFDHNLIPIVLGGANYSNPNLVIPGSFIDAMSFRNVQDLAAYIKEVDSDDEKFNSYFEWKKYWGFQPPNGCDSFYQQLCERINTRRDRTLSSYMNDKECETMAKYFESWITR